MSSASTELKTAQDEMKARLEKLGLPYREIKVYGSQITVEAWSEEAAGKWGSVLSKFAKLRGTIKTLADAKERGDGLFHKRVKVWRVYARVG